MCLWFGFHLHGCTHLHKNEEECVPTESTVKVAIWFTEWSEVLALGPGCKQCVWGHPKYYGQTREYRGKIQGKTKQRVPQWPWRTVPNHEGGRKISSVFLWPKQSLVRGLLTIVNPVQTGHWSMTLSTRLTAHSLNAKKQSVILSQDSLSP